MKRSDLRITSGLLAALSFCGLLLFASCSSSEETARSEGDSPLGSARDSSGVASDTPVEERGNIVTGPTGSVRNREVGLTVGERLKRLDSLMQIVPADSLGILMAEYERLLDSAMGGPASAAPENTRSSTPIASGSPQQSERPRTDPSYPRSTPRSSINGGADERVLVQSDSPVKPDTAFDPLEYSGLRESELDYYRESTTSTPTEIAEVTETSAPTISTISSDASPRATTISPTSGEKRTDKPAQRKKAKGATKTRTGKGKGKKDRKGKAAAAPATTASAPASSEPKSTRSSSLDENYTEGLAHFRAGRYQQAITNLKPVANSSSSSFRTTAKYYFALSLERTGSLAQAASQFRSLSRGSGALADKGWLGYCRVLNAQGRKSEAKKELLRLIKQRPGSSQIANARQMLQKL